MKFIKDNIFIILAVLVVIGLVIFFYLNSRKSKLETKVDSITNQDIVSPVWPNSNPSIYGNQNVVKGVDGIWRLVSGTCELYVTGIVDWAKIKLMSDTQEAQLIADLDNCKGENLPLIQP